MVSSQNYFGQALIDRADGFIIGTAALLRSTPDPNARNNCSGGGRVNNSTPER